MKNGHSDRQYVGMGVHVCPVCLKEHDEVILIDKRLQPTLERRNFVGWAMCPEHEEYWQKGYIALIECTDEYPPTLEEANRTGVFAHLRKEAWPHIFDVPTPDSAMVFVQQGVIDQLRAMVPQGSEQ